MSHFIYAAAKKVNRWPVVDDWKKEMHWSGNLIYQVAGALGVPYMRVACLQQIMKDAEARGAQKATRHAASMWLENHWRKWTALQGTSLFRHVVRGAVLPMFRKAYNGRWVKQAM